MFCKYCGMEIRDGSLFCKFCGKALEEADKDEQASASQTATPPVQEAMPKPVIPVTKNNDLVARPPTQLSPIKAPQLLLLNIGFMWALFWSYMIGYNGLTRVFDLTYYFTIITSTIINAILCGTLMFVGLLPLIIILCSRSIKQQPFETAKTGESFILILILKIGGVLWSAHWILTIIQISPYIDLYLIVMSIAGLLPLIFLHSKWINIAASKKTLSAQILNVILGVTLILILPKLINLLLAISAIGGGMIINLLLIAFYIITTVVIRIKYSRKRWQ